MEGDKSTNIVNTYCSAINSIIENVTRTYDYNYELIGKCDKEFQDISHEIELASPKNAVEGYHMYKAMRDNRQTRRIAKDENELLEGLYQYFKAHPEIKKDMARIQGESQKINNAQAVRTYKPRVRSDLTIEGMVAPERPKFEHLIREWKEGERERKKYKCL